MGNKQIDELTYASAISDATSIPVNNNSAIYEAEQLTVGTLGNFLGARANAIHNLGDVYTNKSSLATDNPGAMPAWTGEYIINATDVYPDLYTWVKVSHPELCVTRAAYDAAISSTGECKYFVVDEVTGSLRFPKYNYTAPDYPWIYCFNAAVPQTTTQGAEYTAALIGKVSKAGDTMTGNLTFDTTKAQFLNNNNARQEIYCEDNTGHLVLYNSNYQGIYLNSGDENKPYYYNAPGGLYRRMAWSTNVAEFSTNVTNVLTEIPQDFYITLNNGDLTLGTGAKVYYPNGTDTFSTYTTATNLTLNKNTNGKYFVFLKSNSTSDTMPVDNCFAGTTAPTVTTTYAIWYDLTTNKIKWTGDNGSTWTEGYSFPIAVIENDTPGTLNASRITHIFNGCGYIADVIFRLPGLSGVLPNGKNNIGLNNINYKNPSVYVNQLTSTGPVVLHMGNGQAHDSVYFVKQTAAPSTNYTLWYNPTTNKMYRKNGDGTIVDCQEVVYAEAQRTNGRISDWQPRDVYRLPDNDKQYNVGKDIGEVFYTYDGVTKKTPAGGLPLFTGAVISNASGSYPDFWEWLVNNNDRSVELTTTEATYQQNITEYGVCPFFVVDTVNDTIRLPLLKVGGRELVKSYKNGTEWYNIYSDGWCEQGGVVSTSMAASGEVHSLYKPFINTNYTIVATLNQWAGSWNAECMCRVMQTSNATFTIQCGGNGVNPGNVSWRACGYLADTETTGFPQKNFKWPWICAYNTAIPVGVAQVEQFQQALDGKVDKANLVDADVVVETYDDGNGNGYRVWSDGWCEQYGVATLGTFSYSFLKPYRDNYVRVHFQSISANSATSTNSGAWMLDTMPTSTGFTVMGGFISTYQTGGYWKAEGYIQ